MDDGEIAALVICLVFLAPCIFCCICVYAVWAKCCDSVGDRVDTVTAGVGGAIQGVTDIAQGGGGGGGTKAGDSFIVKLAKMHPLYWLLSRFGGPTIGGGPTIQGTIEDMGGAINVNPPGSCMYSKSKASDAYRMVSQEDVPFGVI